MKITAEQRRNNDCKICGGLGVVRKGTIYKQCKNCNGKGVKIS